MSFKYIKHSHCLELIKLGGKFYTERSRGKSRLTPARVKRLQPGDIVFNENYIYCILSDAEFEFYKQNKQKFEYFSL